MSVGYTDDFLSDKDSRKSTSDYVLTLGGGVVSWRSIKKKCTVDSTTQSECVAPYEAADQSRNIPYFAPQFTLHRFLSLSNFYQQLYLSILWVKRPYEETMNQYAEVEDE